VRALDFSGMAVLPAMREWQDALMLEALRRTLNAAEAAKSIGVGKTTFYRFAKRMGVVPECLGAGSGVGEGETA
jgi:hypothetical protein